MYPLGVCDTVRGVMEQHLDLPIAGMTCASCANRVERKLNELDGVQASVNYALERPRVDYTPAAVPPRQRIAAVEAPGYRSALPAPPAPAPAGDHDHMAQET